MISSRYDSMVDGIQPSDSHSGLGILPKYAVELGITESDRISFVPPAEKALHTILSADNTQLIPDMKKIFQFITDNNIRVNSDAVTLGIFNTNFNTTFTRYFHFWLPLDE